MLFNSYEYLVFFPVVLIIYYVLPKKLRWLMLLGVSYFFYMCWNVKYVALLIYVTAVTFSGALVINKLKEQRSKKIALGTTIVLSFLTLIIYKYLNFFIGSANSLLMTVTGSSEPFVNNLDIVLPMGISFYTFQAVGYLIDVYRGEVEVMTNPFRYALFISFFPQLVAGPIERAKNLIKQVNEYHKLEFDNLRDGFVLMLWGFFLKLVIADKAAVVIDAIYNNYTEYSGMLFLIASILFALQIYCDFAGYTYIAMGSARMLGFRLMDNFNSPYLATSVAEFWRRWHISLTSWFKDYLYIPLGGSRKGTVRKYINKVVVFLVSGLWHGAEWSFVVWGGLNGIFQVIEEMLGIANKSKSRLTKVLRIVITFVLVDFTWIFFRADNINSAIYIIKKIFTDTSFSQISEGQLFQLGLTNKNFTVLIIAILILLIADVLKYRDIKFKELLYKQNIILRYAFYVVAFFTIVIFGTYGSEVPSTFLYFQF